MNNELERAIATAKKAHDHNDGPADATAVSIGALIRAVEILADQLKDVPASAQTLVEALDTLSTTPAPNLVERLKKAYAFAEMEAIAGGGDPVDMGVRAILTSLSKTPVAMMTADHIATLCGGEDYSPTDRRYARVAVQAFKEFVAPILAAKDARIEELETNNAALERDRRHCGEAIAESNMVPPGRTLVEGIGELVRLHRHAKKNIAELEKQLSASAKTTLLDALERLGDHTHVMNPETEAWSVDEVWTRILKHVDDLVEHRTGGLRERVATLEKQLANARADIEAHVTQARCAAVNLGYPDKTLEDAVRAVGLDKVVVDIDGKDSRLLKILEREQHECLSLITDSLLVMPGRTVVEAVKDLIELHGSAKNKIAELEADKRRADARVRAWEARTGETGPSAPRIVGAKLEPVTVDGKTPGEVCFAAFNPNLAQFGSRVPEDWERAARAVLAAFGDNAIARSAQDCMPGDVLYEAHKFVDDNFPDESNAKRYNMAALAVLRAFGQPSQTTQTNVVAALRRVRERVGNIETHFRGADGMRREHTAKGAIKDAHAIIDNELATLSAEPPNDAAAPKFFANENELRGSYFCTAITLRPYLHVGHDIEFDDIPRILKLSRNDIIEVRVVERAKQ